MAEKGDGTNWLTPFPLKDLSHDHLLVLWIDPTTEGENRYLLSQVEECNPSVFVLQFPQALEAWLWIEQHRGLVSIMVRAGHMRVMTNAYREKDGGIEAGKQVFQEVQTRWKKSAVPVFVYCGNRSVSYYEEYRQKEVKRSYRKSLIVATSSMKALDFLSFVDPPL